ncbi:MAG: hypothetical protein ACRDRA_04950 [Pseudonocardiaceae bacterium]
MARLLGAALAGEGVPFSGTDRKYEAGVAEFAVPPGPASRRVLERPDGEDLGGIRVALGTTEVPMAAQTAPVKVDETSHTLLVHGAAALRMMQKDLLAEAVREYLTARRDQINTALREAMSNLDGTESSRVAALTGLSAERLTELGGVREQ